MSDRLEINTTKKPEKWYLESPAAMSFTLVSCYMLLALLFITPAYDTNDDPGMALVVSGYGNVNGPDEHLIYTNVLIGKALKSLYESAPLIPWYGYYLLLAQFMAHWLLLYALLLLKRNYLTVLGYALFYAVLGVYFMTHVQFTTSAFLIGMAGLALVLSSVILDSKGQHYAWLKWEGALCLIVSSLIRYPSFQMLALVCIPLVLVCLFQYFKLIKFKPYLIPALIAISGVIGCNLYDQQYYQQDDSWREFLQFHNAYAKVVNYAQIPYTDETKPIFDEVGWTAVDYWMLRNWIFLDPDTYSVARARKFKENSNQLKLRKYPQVMQARVQTAKSTISNPTLLFCFFAAIFVARLNLKGRWQRSIVKWLLIWSMLLMTCLIIYLKLPARIFICLSVLPLYFSMMLNLPEVQSQNELKLSRWPILTKFGVVILVLATCGTFSMQVQRSNDIVRKNIELKQDLKILIQKWPDKIFLAFGTLQLDRFLPLDNQSEVQDLKHLFLGSRQRSPLFQQRLKEYNIQSTMTDLYETDRILFISHPKMNPLLKAYAKQHDGVNLKFERILEKARFFLYKVTKEEEKPSKTHNEVDSQNEKI